MNINAKLKKEGIEILEKLDAKKVNTIAINIASKLCLAFPEHNLNKTDLFEAISSLNMYIAKMSKDCSGAKYFYKDTSIYFNEIFDIEEMSELAMHECIHFIQELRDKNNKLIKMGLYTPNINTGLALNEASVQLMAAEANMQDVSFETYYNISFNTISPNCYPLECTLVNELAYFTGTYPLYHSTLNSNDVFKNTFILKSNKKTFSIISKNLDKLLSLENDLNYFSSELQSANKVSSIKLLKKLIFKNKEEITDLFFKTQNLIIENCFTNEFNNIKTLDDIKDFNKKIYNFKDLIGYTDTYTFYNEFYRKMMNAIEQKEEYIKIYGDINIFDTSNNSLALLDPSDSSFGNTFVKKLKKLFGFNKKQIEEDAWYK